MYKLWLVWFYYIFTYKSINLPSETNPNITELFSIYTWGDKIKGSVRKYQKFIATKNEATGIYSFNDKNFTCLDNMLDYILELRRE